MGAKEGFSCIVPQWLVLADEGSLLLPCSMQWLWFTMTEAVRWQEEGIEYLWRESAYVEKT